MSVFYIAQWFRGVSSVQCFILIHKINAIVLLLVCTLGLELFRLTLSHLVVAVAGKLVKPKSDYLISVSLFYFSTIRFVKLQKRCCRLVSAPARKFQHCWISVCDVPGILWRRSAALDGPHSVTKLVNWNVWVNFFIWMVLGFKQRKKCWKRRVRI